MKRNLVLVHLESLNNIMYRINWTLFPSLREIESRSLSFLKYFSTATSTLMVLGDIYYGGLEQYEQCTTLDYIPSKYHYSASLFDDLKAQGYKTGLFIYPGGGDRESAEKRHIAGFTNEMLLKEEYSSFLSAIDELIGEEPFAISLCNYISNLALNFHVDNVRQELTSGTEKWQAGYEDLDKYVSDVFRLLKEKNVLDNTTVILYGDHGDDYWEHSMHKGLTHAIEPYAGLIHTPFMIYDSRLNPGVSDQIVSAEDIRIIAREIISKEELDLSCIGNRKLALARTAYAAQPLRSETFKKAYSVTDGKWLLLVSNDGLELFDIEMDPGCKNNFLNYFIFDNGIFEYNETEYNYESNGKFHFCNFMNKSQKRLIIQKSYYLRKSLLDKVKELYFVAGLSEEKFLQEMNFNKIRYTKNITVG